jgi:hypothetical protein
MQVVSKHLFADFVRGPRAISKHYRVIAQHYSLAGEAKQARIASLRAFLWWPVWAKRKLSRSGFGSPLIGIGLVSA